VPTNLELMQGLREGFNSLTYKDKNELSRLDNRGRMLIRRTFGDQSDYYTRFVRIEFWPMFYPRGCLRSSLWQ
jgi:hypothetical protein